MTDPKPDSAALKQRLKSILDYVHDCERRVHKGEIMDLQGLDNNVVDICNSIATLPPVEAKALEQPMANLIDSLEMLAGSMKEQQKKFAVTGPR